MWCSDVFPLKNKYQNVWSIPNYIECVFFYGSNKNIDIKYTALQLTCEKLQLTCEKWQFRSHVNGYKKEMVSLSIH